MPLEPAGLEPPSALERLGLKTLGIAEAPGITGARGPGGVSGLLSLDEVVERPHAATKAKPPEQVIQDRHQHVNILSISVQLARAAFL